MIPYQPKVQPIIVNTSKVNTSKPLTLKQQRTIEALPKVNNVSSAMRIGGYAESSIAGGNGRQSLKGLLPQLNPEQIIADIADVRNLALYRSDITNLCRIDEHRAKLAGMVVQKTENKTVITDERRAEIDSLFEQWFTPNNTPVADKLT